VVAATLAGLGLALERRIFAFKQNYHMTRAAGLYPPVERLASIVFCLWPSTCGRDVFAVVFVVFVFGVFGVFGVFVFVVFGVFVVFVFGVFCVFADVVNRAHGKVACWKIEFQGAGDAARSKGSAANSVS
jgi:hypothetical protein